MCARVNASVRNMTANPPTNPAIAARSASSSPSGKRSANASASRIPAANAAEYDRPIAPSSQPSSANKLAPAKPIAATAAMRTAFTGAATPRTPARPPTAPLPLPARGAPPVDLQAVGPNLEIAADLGQPSQIQRTLVELGHSAAGLADEVVVVVLGQFVARAVPEVEPAHQSQLREEVQRPVHCYQPYPGAARADPLEVLVLLRPDRLQDRHPLGRRLEPPTPNHPDYPLKLQSCSVLY